MNIGYNILMSTNNSILNAINLIWMIFEEGNIRIKVLKIYVTRKYQVTRLIFLIRVQTEDHVD